MWHYPFGSQPSDVGSNSINQLAWNNKLSCSMFWNFLYDVSFNKFHLRNINFPSTFLIRGNKEIKTLFWCQEDIILKYHIRNLFANAYFEALHIKSDISNESIIVTSRRIPEEWKQRQIHVMSSWCMVSKAVSIVYRLLRKSKLSFGVKKIWF